GLEVKPKYRYSWVASLEYEQKHICSGTLYSGNLVITAASCIKGKLSDWRVSGKRHDLDISADKEKSKYFAVKSTHIHPEYVPATKAYDISIWKIDAPQSNNNLIKLDDGRWSNAGDFLLTVIGWGVGNNYSNLQREIQISIIRGSKCRPLHENLDNFSQFCVSYPQGTSNYCQYEPGAPITILKNGELLLVGIAASDVCIDDKNPGIFIKAGAFVKFI
ncbi:trypsin-like serine protease, partial [Neoconidiobolus thromboides FSU 785]